jgi:hypothetical protein
MWRRKLLNLEAETVQRALDDTLRQIERGECWSRIEYE